MSLYLEKPSLGECSFSYGKEKKFVDMTPAVWYYTSCPELQNSLSLARVVELVDSLASGASARKGVRVRLPPRAPRRSKRHIVCSDFFYKKSERTHFIAPPFQITTAALGCDLASPLCGVFLILQKYRL